VHKNKAKISALNTKLPLDIRREFCYSIKAPAKGVLCDEAGDCSERR
jgi:hypothetical protein